MDELEEKSGGYGRSQELTMKGVVTGNKEKRKNGEKEGRKRERREGGNKGRREGRTEERSKGNSIQTQTFKVFSSVNT